MRSFSSPQNSWQSKLLWYGALIAAGVAVVACLFEILVLAPSFSHISVLLAALFVSMLISRYEVRLPGTSVKFSAADIFAFWGVIWLGLSGGVLVGGCASLARYSVSTTNREKLVQRVAADTLATFFSAVAFYITFQYFASAGDIVLGSIRIPGQMLMASCAMVATHFAQRTALDYLLKPKANPEGIAADQRTSNPWNSLTYAVSFIATIFLYAIFKHFGIELGLVLVPVAVAGDLAYKFHVRQVEIQTKLISEASRIHLATVEALATAIDARDQMGIGHVRRTQIFAVGIGNILGLAEDEISALRTGALLHDIGKLAVPDHILNKPGRLTPAEMEKTKTHALVGASILEKVGYRYPVVPTVKYHHEFWNGTGYPEGLRGSNIPLTARILSVADSYDTLRSARPYRAAVSRDEACNFLRSRAGSQFDPRIVDLFLRNLKIFEAEVEAQQLTYDIDRDAVSVSDVIDDGASPNYVEQIKRANREVFTLYSLARDFSSELDLDEILPLFTYKILELVPFDTSIVYLLDDSQKFATAAHVHGLNRDVLFNRRINVGEGATGRVLKDRKASGSVDSFEDFETIGVVPDDEYLSMASIPLLADDRLIGALSLYSTELSAYEDEHLRLLETVSRIAADAICRSLEHAVTENYALTDPMTGLPNARSLQMQFEKEVKRASRSESSFQVLVLDLDGFKAVNDTYGHKAGDRMLKEIGGVVKDQLRQYDFLARYGGDEFVAIVPDTDSSDVLDLARRIEEAVRGFALPIGNDEFAQVGVSIGTACYPVHGETFDQIIVSADKAMYLTKSFNRKKSALPVGVEPEVHSDLAVPEEIAAIATATAMTDDGLILEVDETHVVTSAAIN
ncbi:MAG TPA: diguanylate cyclase [Pyrinomonadaceae bacterium]|nr:diguanylate cyclase [Pyrinomonadaceae bacterium]